MGSGTTYYQSPLGLALLNKHEKETVLDCKEEYFIKILKINKWKPATTWI